MPFWPTLKGCSKGIIQTRGLDCSKRIDMVKFYFPFSDGMGYTCILQFNILLKYGGYVNEFGSHVGDDVK